MQCRKGTHWRLEKQEIWLEEPCHPQGPTRANQPHCEVVGVVGDVLFEASMSKVGRDTPPATDCLFWVPGVCPALHKV